MGLRPQIVHLVGSNLFDDASQTGGVGQIAVVKEKPRLRRVRIGVQMLDTAGIEAAAASDDRMNFIFLAKKKLGKIRPVLPGDSGKKCDFTHEMVFFLGGGEDRTPPASGYCLITRFLTGNAGLPA
jgi:hypothetical protein